MKKPKLTGRRITEEELKASMSKAEFDVLKESIDDCKFEEKTGACSFNHISASVPIPLRLLKSRISQKDEHLIYEMVALIVNQTRAEGARTLKYVVEAGPDDPRTKRLVKSTDYCIKHGDEDREVLKKLWKRSDKKKLAKYDLSFIDKNKILNEK